MALLFGSFRATASLSNVNDINLQKSAAQKAAVLAYGESLSAAYPSYQLQLTVSDTGALSKAAIEQINFELFMFEQAIQSGNPEDILKNKKFQYLSCRPCSRERPY